jgi:molybdopterin converting factor small subunit
MSVRVRVPTPLRKYTQGADEVSAEGGNIKALVDNLELS